MVFRLRSALPHHSPACTAVPLDKRIPQELPRQSVEGRSGSIIVPMQHRRALPATARPGKAVDRSEVRHRAGFHAAPPHGECTCTPVCDCQGAGDRSERSTRSVATTLLPYRVNLTSRVRFRKKVNFLIKRMLKGTRTSNEINRMQQILCTVRTKNFL